MRIDSPIPAERSFMHRLTVTSYRLASPKLSAPLSIALVSDLHGTCFGPRQEILLDAVRREKPDLVLLCGDILSALRKSVDNARATA